MSVRMKTRELAVEEIGLIAITRALLGSRGWLVAFGQIKQRTTQGRRVDASVRRRRHNGPVVDGCPEQRKGL